MHALAKLCVRRPVLATMLIVSLVVTGIFSYFSLSVDLFPAIDIPSVEIITSDPGASPEAVETEITKKIEDSVNTISQIDELRSTSSEGQSLVLIQFDLSKNGDTAAEEVQNHLSLVTNDLPRTARTPVVIKFDPDAAPILQIAVSAPQAPSRSHDDRRQADQAEARKCQRCRPGAKSSVAPAAKSTSCRIPKSSVLITSPSRMSSMPCGRRIWNCPAAACRQARAN